MARQRTPLYAVAVGEGAKFQEWYDWELASAYAGVLPEYQAAREGAAVHDSSYVGRLEATGSDVLDLLNRLSTNEVVSLQSGHWAPTVLTTDRGRILDVIIVLNQGDRVILLTSPQTRDQVIQFIDKYTIVDDVALNDVTLTTAMLSLIGPDAWDLLGRLVPSQLDSFGPHRSASISIGGVEGYIIRRDLGSLPRFELVVDAAKAEMVWEVLIHAGAVPLGLESYEVLRVEEAEPRYDRELGESYNPLETGLWGSISFTKGCYIGQEVIARLDTYQKVQRHLVSLRFSPNARVAEGVKLARDGKEAGHITSVVELPTTGDLIGLGYVRKEAAEVGTRMSIAEGREDWAKVEALPLPFGPGE